MHEMSGSRITRCIVGTGLSAALGLILALGLIGCASHQWAATAGRSDLASEAIAPGDVDRGHMLFFSREATACAACHTFNGWGEHIGPDLTDVRLRLSADEVHDSIRDPNRRIAQGYQIVLVVTEREMIFGRLAAQTPEGIRLHLADDTSIDVPRRVIEETRLMPTLMPIYTQEHLSDRDVRDLIAFLLLSEESMPPVRVAAAE
jgi:putative heme-binding domain-containing protein